MPNSNAVAKFAYVWNPQLGRGLIDLTLHNGATRRWEFGDQMLFLILATTLNSGKAHLSPQNLLYTNAGFGPARGGAELAAFTADGGENPFPWSIAGKASLALWVEPE